MDQEKFIKACDTVIYSEVVREGIGTLSEKTLHAVLKNYFEPNTCNQEIKIGRHYADIYNGSEIIEIQTKQFNKLRNKLTAFLPEHKVTIVYPITHEKTLFWINEETGEVSKGRKSPKRGSKYYLFKELFYLKSFLNHPNLQFCITLVDVEEYRFLNGWSKDKKKGSSCSDRIPIRIQEEIIVGTGSYESLIPEDLTENFSSKDYAKSAKVPLRLAQTALNLLTEVNAVERVGKKGNLILYNRK